MVVKGSPVKISPQAYGRLKLLATLTSQTQGSVMAQAIDLYSDAHRELIEDAICRARDALGVSPLLERIKAEAPSIIAEAATFGLTNLRIFGSVAEGMEHPTSDIDILVDPSPNTSLVDLLKFGQLVGRRFGRDADVFTPATLARSIRDAVLSASVVL